MCHAAQQQNRPKLVKLQTANACLRSRGNNIRYGECQVSIPLNHVTGNLESPSWFRLEFKANPKKHNMLVSIETFEQSQLKKRLEQVAVETQDAFVFVHGFNVSFENAARRTAQIAHDLKYKFAPLFFSWPSQATPAGYPADVEAVHWATSHLADFLKFVASCGCFSRVHLIAHSMGNRALLNSLISPIFGLEQFRDVFREIALAAPDVDATVFGRDIAPAMDANYHRTTLYASNADIPLMASKAINKVDRLGEVINEIPFVFPGVDSIDASLANTNVLGHGYYGDSALVLNDLFDLFSTSKSPDWRFSLIRKEHEGKTFWKIPR